MAWTDEQLKYAEYALSAPAPTWGQIDGAMMSGPALPHLYYTPILALLSKEVLPFGGVTNGCLPHFVHTCQIIDHASLIDLELLPVDCASIHALFTTYYEECYAGRYGYEVIAMLDPKSKIGRGRIIHPSTQEAGRWQVTHFDREGLSSHTTSDDREKAVLRVIAEGYHLPVTHLLDEMVEQWR